MNVLPQQTPGRVLTLALTLVGTGLCSIPDEAWAGCCKTFQQKHDTVAVESVRLSTSELVINLTLDGMLQGPPKEGLSEGQMYGAVLIPDEWSGVSVGYAGTCTVTLDGEVLAELDSKDPEHVQKVMEEYGIPYKDSSAFQDGQLIKPEWHPDADIAALAELAEPAPAGFHWEGFASDVFDFSRIPEHLMESRIDGIFTTSISIAKAPQGDPVELVIRGGDEAEGIDTVRVPVVVDAGVINTDSARAAATATVSIHRSGGWPVFALAGLAALFGLTAAARRSGRARDDA